MPSLHVMYIMMSLLLLGCERMDAANSIRNEIEFVPINESIANATARVPEGMRENLISGLMSFSKNHSYEFAKSQTPDFGPSSRLSRKLSIEISGEHESVWAINAFSDDEFQIYVRTDRDGPEGQIVLARLLDEIELSLQREGIELRRGSDETR